MTVETSDSSETRQLLFRVYCPRCLRAHEGVEHQGTAERVIRLDCPSCRKSFTVSTSVTGDGRPVCLATPVFIRKPEVVEDNDPPASY